MRNRIEQRTHGRWWRVMASCITVLLLWAFLSVTPSGRAQAVTYGPGIHYGELGHLGAYLLADGTITYCVEVGVPPALSGQAGDAVVSELPAYDVGVLTFPHLGFQDRVAGPVLNDPERMRQINYVVSTWGNTRDDEQAAATQIAVFLLRGAQQELMEKILQGMRDRGGAAVVARAEHIVRDARARAVAPVQGSAPSAPTIAVDEHGNGKVTFGAGTVRLDLEGAVFADSGSSTRVVTAAGNGEVQIRGLRPSGWDRDVDVVVRAEWQSGQEGWPAELQMFLPADAQQQRVVVGGVSTTGHAREGEHEARTTLSNSWWPELSTQVSERIVRAGERFTDRVTVAADPRGGHWTRNAEGTYQPLIATGVLYGPFAEDPSLAPRANAPAGAPVAERRVLHISDGPGEYEVTSTETARATGYYTWVWSIVWDEQPAAVTRPPRTGVSALLADRLPVRDGFGMRSETHVVPQRVTQVTRLSERRIGRGWSITDDVGVTRELDGGWLNDEQGEVIPIVMRGTVYHSQTEPVQQAQPPAEATVVAVTRVSVRGAEIVTSDPVPIPLELEGFITLQWCVVAEDQPDAYRGLTREWCDDYGVAGETASIHSPTVTTLAQPDARVDKPFRDRARVDGPIPHESTLEFTAYLQPEAGAPKYDTEWHDTGETWTTAEIAALGTTACTAQPVSRTSPISITEDGEHESPPIVARSTGTVYWSERLVAVDPITGASVIIHEGACGLPNERTVISEAPPLASTGGGATPHSSLLLGCALGFLGLSTALMSPGGRRFVRRRILDVRGSRSVSSPDS